MGTSFSRGNQPPETIAKLCDAVREELEKKDLTKYVNSILTAYVIKTPPDHQAGLALLLRLKGVIIRPLTGPSHFFLQIVVRK